MTVITLQAFYGGAKLSGNEGKKMSNRGKRVGFETKGESPHVL